MPKILFHSYSHHKNRAKILLIEKNAYLCFDFVFGFGHVLPPSANFVAESDNVEVVTLGQGVDDIFDSLHSMR